MGLGKYRDKVSSSSGGRGKKKKNKDTKVDHDDSHEAYRIIWNGEYTLPMESNEVVIDTKDTWNDLITFLKNNMGISKKEFESFSDERKFEVASVAMDSVGEENGNIDKEIGECLVCGDELSVFDDWDYEEFKDEKVCPGHTMLEVSEAYEEKAESI